MVRMESDGYLYVITFSNGTTKIGQTTTPKKRLAAHVASGKSFGVTTVDSWVSPRHLRPDLSEAMALELAGKTHSRHGREWFAGLDFGLAVEIVKSVPMTTIRTRRISTRSLLSTRGIQQARGVSVAQKLWLCMWPHIPWGDSARRPGDVWVGNKRLANMVHAGGHPDGPTLSEFRRVKRALRLLKSSGMISMRWGRPARARTSRRIISLTPHGFSMSDISRVRPIYTLPSHEALARLRSSIGTERPGATMTVALAALACASMEISGTRGVLPSSPVTIFVPIAQLREMSGAGLCGTAFYLRLSHLESVGLLTRAHGPQWRDGVVVNPIA